MVRIRCGTCAWSDHEEFYPPGLPPTERLRYYARWFPLVEVDSTFYAIQPLRSFRAWATRTPADFLFNVKAYGAMTRHHRTPRPGEENLLDVFRHFLSTLQPLRDTGKLGVVHFQFPPWFTATAESIDYLRFCRELTRDRMAVEFRHRSWFDGPTANSTLALLRELDAVHVICDAPQVGTGTVPRICAVTTPHLSILRLHGRNRATWYKKAERTADRFDYLYDRAELTELAAEVAELAGETDEFHVLMNNNRANYAVRNALDMMECLGLPVPPRDERGVPAPEPSGPVQGQLF